MKEITIGNTRVIFNPETFVLTLSNNFASIYVHLDRKGLDILIKWLSSL